MSDTFNFFTACTTCNARLRVRDAAAIGQIFPCPKCGGMVMIEAPPDPEGLEEDASQTSELSASSRAFFSSTWPLAGLGSLAGLAIVGGLVAYLGSRPDATVTRTTARKPVVNVTPDVRPAIDAPTTITAVDETTSAPPAGLDAAVEPVETTEIADEHEPSGAAGFSPFSPVEAVQAPQQTVAPDPQVAATTDESRDPLLPAEFQPDAELRPPSEQRAASFSELAMLLEGQPAGPAANDQSQEPTSEPPSESAMQVKTTLASASATTDSPAMIDIAARLKIQVKSIDFQDQPLIEFLRFVTELTGVPIQIDPRALRQTGLHAESILTVSAKDVEVGELLRQGLGELGLIHVAEAAVVRVTSQGVEAEQLEERKFEIGDLLRTNQDGMDPARLIVALIEPTSWMASGGAGSIEIVGDQLVVNQSRDVQVQTVLLLEKLRIARGLRRRARTPEQYTLLETKWQQLQPKLSRQISISAWQSARFVDVLRQIELAADLRILVDWRSLLAEGWSRDADSTLVVRGVPAEIALHQLLDAARLVIRPIDGHTVEVTTAKVNAALPDLEFYQLSKLGTAGLGLLKQLTVAEQIHFAIDTASDTALVVAPAAIHQKLIAR